MKKILILEDEIQVYSFIKELFEQKWYHVDLVLIPEDIIWKRIEEYEYIFVDKDWWYTKDWVQYEANYHVYFETILRFSWEKSYETLLDHVYYISWWQINNETLLNTLIWYVLEYQSKKNWFDSYQQIQELLHTLQTTYKKHILTKSSASWKCKLEDMVNQL